MNIMCRQCGNNIPGLDLTSDQLIEVWALIARNFKLFAVKVLMDSGKTHAAAKIIVAHFNSSHGMCAHCGSEGLVGENSTCPECGAFNYNVAAEPPFNADFCSYLEYALDFAQQEDERVRWFGCDGVDAFPNDLTDLFPASIQTTRQLVTRCRIGNDGQDLYEMTLKFGDKAVREYVSGGSLIDCIPAEDQRSWVTIDPDRKIITVRLR